MKRTFHEPSALHPATACQCGTLTPFRTDGVAECEPCYQKRFRGLTSPMTPPDAVETRLREIEQREQKATKGPWHIENINRPRSLDGHEIWAKGMLVAKVAGLADFDFANVEFLNDARADIPYLLTLVEQYREGLKEIAAGKFNAWDARDFAERLLRGEEQ